MSNENSIHFNLSNIVDWNSPQPGYATHYNCPKDHGNEVKQNSQGWRSPWDFDKVDWNNSVLLFGCSQVWGDYLNTEDCLDRQLEALINVPVINLGICGSGPEFAVDTAIQLKKLYGNFKPKAVVHIWSHYLRRMYHDVHGFKFGLLYEEEPSAPNMFTQNYKAMQTFNLWSALWPDSYLIHKTYFADTHNLLDIPQLRYMDHAPDNQHAGPKTNKVLAEVIARELTGKL